ncbi:MAG TPA: hypothetical protein VEW71_08995 [Allosphingosinicella sp.]|nr:hypothetical protein [Allosphingosinicella sp.]
MRRPCARLSIILLALAGWPAAAQPIVTSAGPEEVDVTIYRAPRRPPDEPIDLEWLNGYALISETRRIAIPAGESEIRFEGVAGGIVPQSAIVRGFPEGIVERNRDAYLLSPATLLDRSLGRRVHLRRTSRSTGQVREHEAVIRSAADGAVVLQTADGHEALRCTGHNETLVYDRVPPGLSARPTLSVRTRASRPATAAVTLSYLASGFDWQANYVATLAPDGGHLDLFAWLTLASSDETSFRNADTQAVAGRLRRERVERRDQSETGAIALRCWPALRTSDIPLQRPEPSRDARARPMLESYTPITSVGAEDIVITGSAMRASQENLGDLKLYRIPEPVTVAANSQKQVAFLERAGVQIRFVYRSRIETSDDGTSGHPNRLLVTRNREAEGLGMPLPAGAIQLFDSVGGRPILVGESVIPDRAVGEDVEIAFGEASGVTVEVQETYSGRRREDFLLTVTNDQAVPVRYEAEFEVEEDERLRPREPLPSRHGRPLWAVTVPANGSATLRYSVIQRDG